MTDIKFNIIGLDILNCKTLKYWGSQDLNSQKVPNDKKSARI